MLRVLLNWPSLVLVDNNYLLDIIDMCGQLNLGNAPPLSGPNPKLMHCGPAPSCKVPP